MRTAPEREAELGNEQVRILKIILTGTQSRTQYSRYVGERDSRLSFAQGFRRLGHEVYFFEEVEAGQCLDSEGSVVPFEAWEGNRTFSEAMKSYELEAHSALIYDSGRKTHGLEWEQCKAVASETTLLLAIGGRFRNPEILDAVGHRAYLDINPGKTQAYAFEYEVDYGLAAFDSHFSVGLSMGLPDCPLPTGGFDWKPLLWPVVLEDWRTESTPGNAFTTITTWGRKHQFRLDGRLSGDKVDEWLRFIDVPGLTSQELSLALPMESVPDEAVSMLASKGWTLMDAGSLRTRSDYVDFIAASKGEFSVANRRYVEFSTGWIGDRTPRYLAAGRPALVQSTGLERHLPVGEGLLTFSTLDEAVEGLERIGADYPAHRRRATALAREYFDSDVVLGGLLATVGAS